MLSAHGSAPEVVAAARRRDRVVVNAVCPLVTKVHHEAKVRAQKGYTVLYVGHQGHDEATGTLAVAPDAMRLVEDGGRPRHGRGHRRRPREGRAPRADHALAERLAGRHGRRAGAVPDAVDRGRDDLCFATTNRQQALREIATRADAIVVIGSANSSNTIALTKVARDAGCTACAARSTGPTRSTTTLLADARVVGVTAGASAPEELVQAVIARLAPRDGVETVHVTDEDEYFPPPRDLRELQARLRARGT